MKFKDKDGNVYNTLAEAWERFMCPGPCGDCSLGASRCNEDWVYAHPKAAAHLMGYEVVEDEPHSAAGTCGICEKFVPIGYSGFGRCAITDEEHRSEDKCNQKEDNMDEQKPRICEVLGVEVGEYFRVGLPTHDPTKEYYVSETGTVWRKDGKQVFGSDVCTFINYPENIIRRPRFTEEEVAAAKAVEILFQTGMTGELEREEGNGLWIRYDCKRFPLPSDLFPSIRPGQSVRLSEIVGDAQ